MAWDREATYPPIWIDTALSGYQHGDEDIHNEEANGQEHAQQQDSEAWARSDESR